MEMFSEERMLKKFTIAIMTCASLLLAGLAAEAGDRYGKQKVVYHIN